MEAYRTTATFRHFQKVTEVVYLITTCNFWFEDVQLPSRFVKIYNRVAIFLEIIIAAFVITGMGARYTQHNLTEKQNTDVLTISTSCIIVYVMCGFTRYHKDGIKGLFYMLTVTLNEMFNDKMVERMMIRKSRMYLRGLTFVGCGTMSAYGVKGAFHCLTSNAAFNTAIPIWPDMEDRSFIAGFARIVIYIVWSLLSARILCLYGMIISISVCVGHQFANLYEYFLSLNDIFDGEGSYEEKEVKYENAVKDGIRMHCITLRCVDQLQTRCSVIYSGQVLINVSLLLLCMIQIMQSDRSVAELAPLVLLVTGVLLSSGLFNWSAGDITFEAMRVPTAIFHSGWCNCRGATSVRMRKMITIAIAEAQQPVVIKGFRIIELSYQSYVSIVKSVYSLFSVIY